MTLKPYESEAELQLRAKAEEEKRRREAEAKGANNKYRALEVLCKCMAGEDGKRGGRVVLAIQAT